MTTWLAIDLGAESGRAILGWLEDGTLRIEEVHRFANEPVALRGRLSWDLPRIVHEVRRGIRHAAERTHGRLDGIAVDSWGVDFGLVDRGGHLLQSPVHYRDRTHIGSLARVTARVPRDEIWARTGVQLFEINTLFQLAALRVECPELIDAAGGLLLVGDLVAYFLGGRPVGERTLASTSQLIDATTGSWSPSLLDAIDVRHDLMPEIVESGTIIGRLDDDTTRDAGLASAPPIIAAASHDTAAAVASVPAADPGAWAFLSSGTWSIVGVETRAPSLTTETLERGFTNEAGVAGTTRLLRLITGLWIVQECRRQWARDGDDWSYETLARLAEESTSPASRVDPDDPRFASPGDMPERVRDACRERGDRVPNTPGEVVLTVLESLAEAYARAVRDLEEITGRAIARLHVVGGGSRHALLNRLTAKATGLPLVVGPVEATAIGNLLLQALATGEIRSLTELRSIVAASGDIARLEARAR